MWEFPRAHTFYQLLGSPIIHHFSWKAIWWTNMLQYMFKINLILTSCFAWDPEYVETSLSIFSKSDSSLLSHAKKRVIEPAEWFRFTSKSNTLFQLTLVAVTAKKMKPSKKEENGSFRKQTLDSLSCRSALLLSVVCCIALIHVHGTQITGTLSADINFSNMLWSDGK